MRAGEKNAKRLNEIHEVLSANKTNKLPKPRTKRNNKNDVIMLQKKGIIL